MSAALAADVAAASGFLLDAPVSGSIATLEAGQLSIMVGGDGAAYERVRPLLLQIGPKVMRIGENGQALIVKLAINNTLVAEMVAFCENVAMAEKGGVKREVPSRRCSRASSPRPCSSTGGPSSSRGTCPPKHGRT